MSLLTMILSPQIPHNDFRDDMNCQHGIITHSQRISKKEKRRNEEGIYSHTIILDRKYSQILLAMIQSTF